MAPETSPPLPRLLRHSLLVAALYSAAALVYLRPIWTTFRNSLAPNAADPVFSVYILQWVVRQIRLGFPDVWDANFFYPARGTLALSDHMLGPAFQIAFIHDPIAGYNLLFFSSFVLCGVSTWWVLRHSGLSGPAALLGGAAFAFSPFRMSHLNHLMMLIMQWMPLTLWSWDRLLGERTLRRAALFLLFYGLHLTAGCYFAYMIHFPMAAILASRWAAAGRRRLLAPDSLRVLAPVAALALAAAVAVFLPYLRQARRLDMTHDDHEIGHRGATLASYVSPAPENLYSLYPPRGLWDRAGLPRWQQPLVRSENSLFAGFVPTLLAGYGLWEIRRRYRVRPAAALAPRRRWLLRGLAAVAVAAVAVGDLYTLGFAADLAPLDRWNETGAWIALGALLLFCLGLLAALRRRFAGGLYLRWNDMDPWQRGLLLAGAVSFALSLPVIYMPLSRVIPGLHSMRVPARFGAFVSLTVAFLAGCGLDRLAERLGLASLGRGRRSAPADLPQRAAGATPTARTAPRRTLVAAGAGAWAWIAGLALAAVLAVELAPRPVRWVEVLTEDEFPEVYTWIRGRPEIRALVEVPLRPNWTEATYMYYSTAHWKPIANGYSSFVPDSYDRLAAAVRLLPEGDGLSLLESMGITHVVVHTDLLAKRAVAAADAQPQGNAMVREWERRFRGRRVELVYPGDPERVYRIIPMFSAAPPLVLPRRSSPAAAETASEAPRAPGGPATPRRPAGRPLPSGG
jgi:membrane protein YfhO